MLRLIAAMPDTDLQTALGKGDLPCRGLLGMRVHVVLYMNTYSEDTPDWH
jgi:hypothetical protein